MRHSQQALDALLNAIRQGPPGEVIGYDNHGTRKHAFDLGWNHAKDRVYTAFLAFVESTPEARDSQQIYDEILAAFPQPGELDAETTNDLLISIQNKANDVIEAAWETAQADKIEHDGRFYDYLTLQYKGEGDIAVYGWSTYEESSVLAGQPMKVWLDSFGTEEEARAAFPQAGGFSSKWTEPQVNLNHLPDENTPVAGGMYPDDIDDSDKYDVGDWSR
jgi:hypothetical protein